jgi:antitoxin component YwqK of YwqJK toxin-antitoxin module
MAIYSWNDGELILQDPTLPLDLAGPFQPLLLPENPHQGQIISTGVQVQISYADTIPYAYGLVQDGHYEGEYRFVYSSGSMKCQQFYLQGLLHGPSRCYTAAGQLTASSWYWQGQQQGQVLTYYADGSLYSCQHYLNGLRHHTQHYYYQNGNLKTLMHYQHGKLQGTTQLYHSDGAIDRLLIFDNGRAAHVDIRPPHSLHIG